MSVEEVLEVASMVDSDPMTGCLVTLDQASWQSLIDLFETFSTQNTRESFFKASQAIKQDPIVKGKLSQFLLCLTKSDLKM